MLDLNLPFWQAVAKAWSQTLSAAERDAIASAVAGAVEAQRQALDPNRKRVSSALDFLLGDEDEEE